MRYIDILLEVLEYYRREEMSHKVTQLLIDDAHTKDDATYLLRQYSDIDRLSKKLKKSADTLSNAHLEERVDTVTSTQYNELVDKYNDLYFALYDILR